LPGTLLVNGEFDKAKTVLDNFLRHQFLSDKQSPLYGRVPNRVAANTETIYNTADGTPWLIRELYEYAKYSGDRAYLSAQLPRIEAYIDGVKRHWLDKHGLLTHDDADSWMDARIEGKQAWSPRGNRAIEIQVLWINVLSIAAELQRSRGQIKRADEYIVMVEQAKRALNQLFWQNDRLADRLRSDDTPDSTMRPNQVMAISLPFNPLLSLNQEAQVLRNAANALLLPYGVLSLAPSHTAFHPKHQNPAFHHKDAAYHNGTIWGWNAGFMITALNKFGRQDLSWTLTQHLADQILHHGTRGTMSELLDATLNPKKQITPSGTYAQAWSVAEFARNAMQDFLGFHSDILHHRLMFTPALPAPWTHTSARLHMSKTEVIDIAIEQNAAAQKWTFTATLAQATPVQMNLLSNDGSRRQIQFALHKKPRVLTWDGAQAALDSVPIQSILVQANQKAIVDDIRFAAVPVYDEAKYPMLKGKAVLQESIRSGDKLF